MKAFCIACVVLGMISFILVGCGHVHVGLDTNIKVSGEVVQKVTIEGSGMMGEFLIGELNKSDPATKVWDVSTTRSGDLVSIIGV